MTQQAPAVLQLNIAGGQAHEEGPYALAQPVKIDGSPAYLFIACEADGPFPEDTCQLLASTLLTRLGTGRRSVTGRLQEALAAVHDQLLQENVRSVRGQQTALSVACGVLRASELYVATGGPALALVFGPAGVRDLSTAPAGDPLPLGSSRSVQVWVRRHELQPAERVVLLSSGSVLAGPKDPVLGAFSAGLEAGMARLYQQAGSGRFPAFGAIALEERPVPVADPVAAPEPSGNNRPYSYGRSGPAYYAEERPTPVAAPPSRAPVPKDRGPAVSVPLRVPNLTLRRPKGPPPRILAAAGVLAASIAFALVLQTAAQERQAQAVANTAAQMSRAADFFSQAQEAETGDDRRRLLRDAMRQIDAVQRAQPENPDASALAGRVHENLTRLDAVVTLKDVQPLGEPPQGQALYRDLVFQNGNLYLLDKSGDRVLSVPVQDPSLAAQYTTVYQGRGATGRRNLVALVALPRGGAWPRESLLALDENRGLLELRPGAESRPLPLRGAAEWGSFQAAAGYEGSLYILDPRDSQVWRYVPTDSGFDTERRTALPSVDLRDAVDLAVDGDVYVLLRTGRILKFSGGRAQPFSLDGLDPPLSGQGTIHAGAGTILHVVDSANRRVVAFQKEDGRFLYQFPTGDLPPVQAIWADEAGKRLYLATDAKVYAAALP